MRTLLQTQALFAWVAGLALWAGHHTVAAQSSTTYTRPLVKPTYQTTVIGLVNLDDYKAAVLEINSFLSTNDPSPFTWFVFVTAGESYDDQRFKEAHTHFEITRVDFDTGIVEARENGTAVSYSYQPDRALATNSGPATLRWNEQGEAAALELYGGITGKTLLIYPTTKTLARLTIAANPRNKSEAIRDIESALNRKGIILLPDGGKFTQVVPKLFEKRGAYHPVPVISSKDDPAESSKPLLLYNYPLNLVTKLYADLAGMRPDTEGVFPAIAVSVRARNRLEKSEQLHALDVLLGWQGIRMVKVNDNTLKASITSRDY